MPLKPGLTQDHIPVCKFGDLECQGFQMLVDGKIKGTGVCKLIFRFSSVNDNEGFWFWFQGKRQIGFTAKSKSMNSVDALLSIIVEPVVSLFRRAGTIIRSLYPRSAELIPVDPKPWYPRLVVGNSSTRMHSEFSICSTIN